MIAASANVLPNLDGGCTNCSARRRPGTWMPWVLPKGVEEIHGRDCEENAGRDRRSVRLRGLASKVAGFPSTCMKVPTLKLVELHQT